MTTPFDLAEEGGSPIFESVLDKKDELDFSTIWVMKSLINFILTEDLNLLAQYLFSSSYSFKEDLVDVLKEDFDEVFGDGRCS